MAKRIYRPVSAESAELCHPVDPADFDRLVIQVDGRPIGARWVPVKVRLIREEFDGTPLSVSDAPWLAQFALIMRARAVEAMEDVLASNGELLPLECADARLWLYNPALVADAIDLGRSEVVRFDSGGIMKIARHAFNFEAIGDRDVFKLPIPVSETYVSESFVTRWRAAGLRGLDFLQVP